MKKRKTHTFIFLLLICIIGLIGCTRTRIIDKISIIHLFGFDLGDKGEFLGTALFPDYNASKSGDQIQYLEEQAYSSNLIVAKMASYTSSPIGLAKIEGILFGKSYAETGIKDIVERLIMTPQLGTNIQIAASTHSARETLKGFKKQKSLTLSEQIEHNMQQQNLPYMNLHVFLNHFYGAGLDAYVPMLTIGRKDLVKLDGIGVFKDDKLKLHLDSEQTVLFSFIKDDKSQATYKIDVDDQNERRELIIVKAFRSKTNWDWDKKKEQIYLRLQLKASINQYPDRFNLDNPDDVKNMRKIIEKHLKRDIENLLAILKENKVDPLGIGNIVRSKDTSWKAETFYEQYPTLPIHLNVDLQIIHSGLED